ncbi:MAG TPA: AI-2E family transporter [Kofleriaceae bacterium]|jgi:predicted PurR-regulated permease PerM
MAEAQLPPQRWRIELAPKTIALVVGVLAAIWLVGQLTNVLTVIIVALVLVGTFDPGVAWLERRGLRRGRALVCVFLLAALLFAGLVLLMVPPLLSQFLDLVARAPKARTQLLKTLSQYTWSKPFIATIKDLPLDNLAERTGQKLIGYSTELLTTVGYGISTLFLAIYLLLDPARSKGMVYAITPRHHHVKLAKILLELKVIVGGYMRGQLITSLCISLFVFVLLTAWGADNALAIALFSGITDVIPFVGSYIAAAPVILAVTPHGATAALIVVALMVLYTEFESRILIPRVYGRVLRLQPAIVLVALLVGGTVAGILGALLALPIAAGVQMVIRELRVDLPGEATASHDEEAQLDERASEMYEALSENVPDAANAGLIADDLANIVRRAENGGPRFSAQLPAISSGDSGTPDSRIAAK